MLEFFSLELLLKFKRTAMIIITPWIDVLNLYQNDIKNNGLRPYTFI